MVYGQQLINGHWYLFDKTTGAMQRGFQDLTNYNDEKTVYYNKDGWMLYGQQNIADHWYNFDKFNGAMKRGLAYIPEQNKTVFYNNKGQMQYGWQWAERATRYFDTYNGAMKTGQQKIGAHWYLFDKNGAMQRGFQNLKAYGEDKTVYYNNDGWMLYGWQSINNETHHFDKVTGAMSQNQQKIDGHWYLFDKNGVMQRGLQNLKDYGEDKTVYYNNDGWMQYGWQWVNNATHYFDKVSGAMKTGQQRIDGHWYLFDNSGAMQRGVQYIPEQNKLVYYNKDGWMLYGQQKINGQNYNFDTFDGKLKAKGEVKLADNWYLFDNTGKVLTGFQDLTKYGQNKVAYYDPTTAQMQYGYKNIAGNWYLFDNYNGSLQKGVKKVNGVLLPFDEKTGALLTGIQNINGKTYFVNKISGNIQKNVLVLDKDKNWLYFDETTGEGTNALAEKFKQGTTNGNTEFTSNNSAYTFDKDSFENIDNFLTADTWYRPRNILQNGTTWVSSTASDFRPLLMAWWPNVAVKVDYLNYMKDHGYGDSTVTYTTEMASDALDNAAQKVQRDLEKTISAKNDTKWLRELMSDFVKTESFWNKDSESESTSGIQKFQGGFLRYVNSDQTPYANSNWRLIGYQPAMLTDGDVGAEFLLANDIDNSNPIVQAEQLNWLHYLMNFGTITANDPDANFDGIRIDAVDNVDASLLSLAGDYLREAYKVDQNDATANKHISILEDWDYRDPEYAKKIGNPQLTMDNFAVQQMKFSLGQVPGKNDSMRRFKEWYLVDRSKDDTENQAIPNYSFVRAHDASVQEDILQLIQDTTGKPWGKYTSEELAQGLKDYMADQKLTNKKYNRYNIPSSYAIMLTNKDTIPRVYYGDLFSDAGQYMAEKSIYFDAIDNLMKTRVKYVSGGQTLDVDQNDIMTSVRFGKGAMDVNDTGNAETRTQGIGLIISNKTDLALKDGEKVVLHMGAAHKNQAYRAAMLATKDGLVNYSSDKDAPIVYTDNNGDLVFTNKDVVTNGQVQANTAITGVFNPQVAGYIALWVPAYASEDQDARTAPETRNTNDKNVFRSNAALDSNLIYEGFSNFQAFPTKESENTNVIIAKNVDLFKSWGVTSFQLAPQYVSSHDGTFLDSVIDNGYAFTDRYDLAMSKNNKYGSHQDLINVLKALHAGGIQVIADWVPDQIYNLPTKQVVSVVRVDEFGKKIDGTPIDNTLYVVNSQGGGKYQAQYGGQFLEQLKQQYPTLFTTKQPSTGVTIDPSVKITEWSAKYLNGTNILHRGSDYVLHDGNKYYSVKDGSVFIPGILMNRIIKNGFWKDGNVVNYYDSNGYKMKNAFVKDADNNWYYFDENGNMVVDNVSKTIQSDGVTADYYFLENGISLRNGFLQTANGDLYYYDGNGRRVKSQTFTVGNSQYTADSQGKITSGKALKSLDKIVSEGKTTLI